MISHLSDIEKSRFDVLHTNFGRHATINGVSATAAAFLCIGALVVIGCSCACLKLEGVNAMRDIFYPAILPSLCAIVISIPFIILCVIKTQEQQASRKEILDGLEEVITNSTVIGKKKKRQVKFIVENLLDEKWSPSYQTKLIMDLKERYSEKEEAKKEKSTPEKKFLESLDKVIEKINKPKKLSKT